VYRVLAVASLVRIWAGRAATSIEAEVSITTGGSITKGVLIGSLISGLGWALTTMTMDAITATPITMLIIAIYPRIKAVAVDSCLDEI
jgi:hypothetical protein